MPRLWLCVKGESEMKTALAYEMREMDRQTTEKYLIPSVVLMENAARTVFDRITALCAEKGFKSAAVVCGTGNNGGDGFALARMLDNAGIKILVIPVGNTEKIKGDALINYNIAKKISLEFSDDINCAEKYDIIVDAIFGTGFKGEPKAPFNRVIEKINSFGKYVVSIDVPSGINADTGCVSGACVKADETVTFVMPKTGMLFYPAYNHCGKITVSDIGMPKEITENFISPCMYITDEEAKKLLPKRKPDGNKGTFGRLYVAAGSENMMGAAYFASAAGYRTGCGLVYCFIPQRGVKLMQSLLPEAVERPVRTSEGKFYSDSFRDIENDIDMAKAVIIGPGIDKGEEVTEFVKIMLKNCKNPVIIDADAINAAAKDMSMLKNISVPSVITPHIGEMSRLMSLSVAEIKSNMIGYALDFAKKHNIVTVLKDARTVIASPDGRVYVNTSGNCAMSTGGSGDVLTGIIGGFVCQGMDVFEAAVLGVFVHGRCGDYAAEKMGHYGVLAGNLIDALPYVIKNME